MQLTALLHKREQIVQELFAFGVIIDFIELKREIIINSVIFQISLRFKDNFEELST